MSFAWTQAAEIYVKVVDSLPDLAISSAVILVGILLIYHRGVSYWIPWKLINLPKWFYQITDTIAGIGFCAYGLL